MVERREGRMRSEAGSKEKRGNFAAVRWRKRRSTAMPSAYGVVLSPCRIMRLLLRTPRMGRPFPRDLCHASKDHCIGTVISLTSILSGDLVPGRPRGTSSSLARDLAGDLAAAACAWAISRNRTLASSSGRLGLLFGLLRLEPAREFG
jgi:hypothetical protein